jgi:hypothetical protein
MVWMILVAFIGGNPGAGGHIVLPGDYLFPSGNAVALARANPAVTLN